MPGLSQTYEEIWPVIEGSNEDEAIRVLESFVHTNADHVRARTDLGRWYQRRGNKERAFDQFLHVARLSPANSSLKKQLADFCYVELGRPDEAMGLYRDFLVSKPDDVETLLILANLSVSSRKFADARAYYEKILSVQADHSIARESLKVLRDHERRASIPQGPDPTYAGFRQMLRDGDTLSADDTLEELIRQKTAHYREATERDVLAEDQSWQRYRDVQRIVRDGSASEAIGALESYIHDYPRIAVARNDLGVLYYRAGQKEKALQQYLAATELEPANEIFQMNLAEYYFVELGDVEQALSVYVRLLRKNPRSVDVLLALGEVSIAVGKPEDARAFLSAAQQVNPTHEEVRQLLAMLREQETSRVRRPGTGPKLSSGRSL